MSDYRNQLAVQRERQLAALREKNGMCEQFTLHCACAMHDKEFRAVFVKRPGAARYAWEKSERIADRSGLPSRGTSHRPNSKTIKVEEADFDFLCEFCGSEGWTLCKCGAFVCGQKKKGNRFQCRASCGREYTTQPLTEVPGSSGHSPAAAIGHLRAKLLPGSAKRIEGGRS